MARLREGTRLLVEGLTDALPRSPLSRYGFIRRYAGKKKVAYTRAAQSLRTIPLSAKDARISGFVKVENTDGTDKEPVPRLISARGPRYGVELGRFLCTIEKDVFKTLAMVGYAMGWTMSQMPQVMKGLNLRERARVAWAKWTSFRDPVAVSLDGNRFDQHISRDALEWEHSVYNATFRDPYLRWLLRQQLRNRGSARLPDGTSIEWCVDGVRQSGDMNTSLGNCLIMTMVTMHICGQLGVRVELLNDGDDTVIMCERADSVLLQQRLEDEYLQFGLSVRYEGVTDVFERIVFCQFSPVLHHDGWRFVRNPNTQLAKMASGTGNWADPHFVPRLLWAQGKCCEALYAGTPVLGAWARQMTAAGTPPRTRRALPLLSGLSYAATADLYDGQDPGTYDVPVVEPTPETRVSFFMAFGISPAEQRICERAALQFALPSGPARLRNWSDVRAESSITAISIIVDRERGT